MISEQYRIQCRDLYNLCSIKRMKRGIFHSTCGYPVTLTIPIEGVHTSLDLHYIMTQQNLKRTYACLTMIAYVYRNYLNNKLQSDLPLDAVSICLAMY